MGRQPANTKISGNVSVRRVRVRGGNFKFRALRLDQGNFSWGSEVRLPCCIAVSPWLPYPTDARRLLMPVDACRELSRWGRLEQSPGFPQAVTRKVRLVDVVYNASNNELVLLFPPVASLSQL